MNKLAAAEAPMAWDPDVEHGFNAQGHAGAMLFVDPESTKGRWLASALTEDITAVPQARVEACVGELRALWERPIEGMEVGDLVRHCIRALSPGVMPARKLDARIAAALAAIRARHDLRMSLEAAAQTVQMRGDFFEIPSPFRAS